MGSSTEKRTSSDVAGNAMHSISHSNYDGGCRVAVSTAREVCRSILRIRILTCRWRMRYKRQGLLTAPHSYLFRRTVPPNCLYVPTSSPKSHVEETGTKSAPALPLCIRKICIDRVSCHRSEGRNDCRGRDCGSPRTGETFPFSTVKFSSLCEGPDEEKPGWVWTYVLRCCEGRTLTIAVRELPDNGLDS